MLSYHFLLDLAIILLSTKVLGLVTKKINMPQVVGALLAGLILGPAILSIVHETNFIMQIAEIGVIVLMFSAGLEIEIDELKKCGLTSFIVALCGVILPLAGGFLIAALYNGGITNIDSSAFLENVFIGVILTATSVSITVETLQEMGKLKTRTGTVILGAALIDDILGIILLTIVTSSNSAASESIGIVLIRIFAFFLLAVLIGIPFFHFFNRYSKMHNEKRRFPIIAFAFCLSIAYIAEHFFGVADIAGAFIAGMIISRTTHSKYISRRFSVISYLLLSPIFFASIGIRVNFGIMDGNLIIFSLLLLIAAFSTKIMGGAIGGMLCKFTKRESLQIGTGMVSRGEVSLIMANKAVSSGLMRTIFLAPIILMVIITAIITPILLKYLYTDKEIVCTDE